MSKVLTKILYFLNYRVMLKPSYSSEENPNKLGSPTYIDDEGETLKSRGYVRVKLIHKLEEGLEFVSCKIFCKSLFRETKLELVLTPMTP